GKLVGERQYVEPDSLPSALPTVNNYGALLDELLILPYAASPEEIRAWYELGAPFYDATESIGIDTPEGHVIEIDRRGILITPAGFPQRGAHLDGRMLGFWDIHNVPAIGVGDVRSMAQQLGSNMQYGLLMNQGEIRASQSVLQNSLVDASVTSSIIAPGSVLNNQLGDHAVTLPKLHEAIHVVQNGFQNILRYENTSTIQRSVGSSWVTMHSWTIPKQDDNHLMEICRLEFEAEFGTSTGYARLLINGNLVQEFGP